MPDAPIIWTDGGLVLDQVTGVSSSGSGFFAPQVGGGMLIMFALLLAMGVFVRVSVRFRGLYRLFRGLSCGGVILDLQSFGVLLWVLTIRMCFVTLDGFWMVVLALLLLSLSMMVIFFCSSGHRSD